MMRALASMVALAASSFATVAKACSSCVSPLEENRQAFVDTTIFLTVVPLVMLGGFVWFLRRRAREIEKPKEIPVPESLLRDLGPFSRDR